MSDPLAALLQLSHDLGREDRPFAILGEGNTSARLSSGRFAVKASGCSLGTLTAGDLTVDGIEGNKDIESHAGDLTIDVGRAEDYSHVDAALWAGDLEAPPFNVSKGGLFRSFDWKGGGAYTLHAHLKAGDLRLVAKGLTTR